MSGNGKTQLSLALVFDDDEEMTASLEVTLNGETTETDSNLALVGVDLQTVSAALALALEIVKDIDNWERVSALAEREMCQAQDPDTFPF